MKPKKKTGPTRCKRCMAPKSEHGKDPFALIGRKLTCPVERTGEVVEGKPTSFNPGGKIDLYRRAA